MYVYKNILRVRKVTEINEYIENDKISRYVLFYFRETLYFFHSSFA